MQLEMQKNIRQNEEEKGESLHLVLQKIVAKIVQGVASQKIYDFYTDF